MQLINQPSLCVHVLNVRRESRVNEEFVASGKRQTPRIRSFENKFWFTMCLFSGSWIGNKIAKAFGIFIAIFTVLFTFLFRARSFAIDHQRSTMWRDWKWPALRRCHPGRPGSLSKEDGHALMFLWTVKGKTSSFMRKRHMCILACMICYSASIQEDPPLLPCGLYLNSQQITVPLDHIQATLHCTLKKGGR